MQDPVLNKVMEEWEKSSDDPKVREIYFARQKAVLDEKAAIRAAELRLRDAIKQGKEEVVTTERSEEEAILWWEEMTENGFSSERSWI